MVVDIDENKKRIINSIIQNRKPSGKILSKMMSHYTKEHGKSIISYSHRRLFKGDVYTKNGFELINHTPPSYFWIDNNCRVLKRYQTQKHKLPKLLGDSFDPNLTEIANMLANGYKRVWDCGQRVFALN